MNSIIKDSFRYFLLTFLAFAAALLVVSVVRAATWTGPSASFPNGNVSWPVNCGSTAGQALMTNGSGELTCGTIQAVYQ